METPEKFQTMCKKQASKCYHYKLQKCNHIEINYPCELKFDWRNESETLN